MLAGLIVKGVRVVAAEHGERQRAAGSSIRGVRPGENSSQQRVTCYRMTQALSSPLSASVLLLSCCRATDHCHFQGFHAACKYFPEVKKVLPSPVTVRVKNCSAENMI